MAGKGPKKGHGGRPKIPVVTEDLGELADKLPPRPINMTQVMYWMDLGAPAEEIAGSFHVSVDTLDRRLKETYNMTFAEMKEKVCGAAKLRLRNNQFRMSEHNCSMAIWLGKNWLGQKDTDKHETNVFVNNKEFYEAMDRTKNPLENPKIDSQPEDSYS